MDFQSNLSTVSNNVMDYQQLVVSQVYIYIVHKKLSVSRVRSKQLNSVTYEH